MNNNIGKYNLPFKVVSSSLSNSYINVLAASFRRVDIVNYHQDVYGDLENTPMQGVFTETHVGGNQHRHILLNTGSDDNSNRPEAYRIIPASPYLTVLGPHYLSVNHPSALYTRGLGIKSPINIENIRDTDRRLGNFSKNYQVVQGTGRRELNNLIVDNYTASGVTTTPFIYGTPTYSLPEITNNSKSIFVSRFSAPGSKEESSRGVLDREGEEYSSNNSINFRNIKVRQPFYSQLTQHSPQFGSGSGIVSIHKTNRNTLSVYRNSGDSVVVTSSYDNYNITRAIPRSDLNYSWITGSAITSQAQLGGYQRSGSVLGGPFEDIQYASSSYYVSGGAVYEQDFYGLRETKEHRDEVQIYAQLENKKDEITFEKYSFGKNLISDDKLQIPATALLEYDPNIEKKVINLRRGATVSLTQPFYGDVDFEVEYLMAPYYPLNLFSMDLSPSANPPRELAIQYSFIADAPASQWITYLSCSADPPVGAPSTTSSLELHKTNFTVRASDFAISNKKYYLRFVYRYPSGFIVEHSTYAIASIKFQERNSYKQNIIINNEKIGGSFSLLNGKGSQTRIVESQITKRMKERNYISVKDEPKQVSIINAVKGKISIVKPKQPGSVTNFKEPMVTSKYKPLKQDFILKGDLDKTTGNRFIHSYANNLSAFANKHLNQRLNIELNSRQLYDELYDLYVNEDTLEVDNPFEKLVKLTYSETIYPREENTFLEQTRKRKEYILDKSGYSDDGFDKQLGTQRVFWRDNIDDRQRTQGVSKNSQNYVNNVFTIQSTGSYQANGFFYTYIISASSPHNEYAYTSSFSSSLEIQYIGNSVAPIDKLESIRQLFTASFTVQANYNNGQDITGTISQFYRSYTYDKAGELNSVTFVDSFASGTMNSSSPSEENRYFSNKIPRQLMRDTDFVYFQNYLGKTATVNNLFSSSIADTYFTHYSGTISGSSTSLRKNINSPLIPSPRVKYVAFLGGFETGSRDYSDPFANQPTNTVYSTLDSGLQYKVEEMSGKKPWFDSYEEYSSDIQKIAKEYSIIPEFNISEHMKYYVDDLGGDFRAKNKKFITLEGKEGDKFFSDNYSSSFSDELSKYAITDQIFKKNKIEEDYGDRLQLNRINFSISGIKKLLPYNGFYPIERTIQLANMYSDYAKSTMHGGLITWLQNQYGDVNFLNDIEVDSVMSKKAFLQTALEPFFAPGILYNTIKSGIAVDWPAISASNFQAGNNIPYNEMSIFDGITGSILGDQNNSINYRIPFENIIFPKKAFNTINKITSSLNNVSFDTLNTLLNNITLTNSIESEGKVFHFKIHGKMSNRFCYSLESGVEKPSYSLAMSNFLAEIPHFFLKDENLVSFLSAEENQFKTLSSERTYYMDVVLKKSDNLVMIEAYSSSYNYSGSGSYSASNGPYRKMDSMNGRYFGWPVYKNSLAASSDSLDNRRLYLQDPAYAPFTPSYFEGTAIARIKFAPSQTKKYSLDEIFASSSVENLYPGLYGRCSPDSPAYRNKMPLSSSVNLFGIFRNGDVEYDLKNANDSFNKFKPTTVRNSSDTARNRWVIGTKMETPVLDFSEQPFVSNTGSYWISDGFGRGMWSGYGKIPTGSQGITIELRESFPFLKSSSSTGSLLEVCGFRPETKKIGELADTKEISEAIILIPYLERKNEKTINIDGFNFITIDLDVFNLTRKNVENGDAAIKSGDLGSKKEYRETSISQMLKTMQKYVIPPRMDFLTYSDIKPFIMYMFEFKHTLDKQDLADIWQGVMPKIAMTAEKDQINVGHETGPYEFFHGKEVPDEIKFLVFKVKKKAEKNYYAVTADSTDDDRFKFDFKVGRKSAEYSFNWPFDQMSLVELAKVDITLEYVSKDSEERVIQKSGFNLSEIAQKANKDRTTRRGKRNKNGGLF